MSAHELIQVPGYAYCTAPEGTSLKYGERVLVLRRSGKNLITKKGRFQAIRFSPDAPAMDAFCEKPVVYPRKNKFVEHEGQVKTYREVFLQVVAEARQAFDRGETRRFCEKLFTTHQ